MKTLCCAVIGALYLSTSALCYAQSTGTIDAESAGDDDIVVRGRVDDDAIGIGNPDSPKARAVVTQDFIAHTVPGQSILNAINLIPGVNYIAGDPYGGTGGGIRIRGFDGSRLSFTFDGLPLNDAGNYAIYANQQIDPELVESVNVNFGATDVDSPTASAAGGTVNYRTIVPTDRVGATAVYSHGAGNMNRVFGLINTGTFTSFGTKAWVSASTQSYDLYRYGIVKQSQYNARLYQPLAREGDFVSLAGFFHQHRNRGYGTPSLANINARLGTPYPTASATPAAPVRVDLSRRQFDTLFDDTSFAYMNDPNCTLPSGSGVRGTAQDDRRACTNARALGFNPTDVGNARLNSRLTLSDRLTFTVDGGYSYTLANGGGSNVLAEADANANATGAYRFQFGRLGAGIAPGVDINRDGDLLDYVRVFFPSNTNTHRLMAIGGLRYDLDDANLVRIAYTWDRARTRQTGEASVLGTNGYPLLDFSAHQRTEDAAVRDAAGNVFTKRDRLSYAILHQLSAEYRGRPIGEALELTLGLRGSLFRRNLSNYCYTIAGSGSDAYCTAQTAAQVAANPATAAYAPPYDDRVKEYRALLPNLGFTYALGAGVSGFGSYAKGFSAPRTDLYAYDDTRIVIASGPVAPERTDSFDLGLRYGSALVQAQVAGWYIRYDNRIVSSTVPLNGGGTINVDRNVGAVDSKGVDASVTVNPTRWLSAYGFVSYLNAELKQDVVNVATGAVTIPTRGKSLVDTPNWQYGGRVQVTLPSFTAGVSAKHVGDRFATDVNDVVSAGYTLVDLDAQLGLGFAGLDKTYLQVNVVNLFDKAYFGNLGTGQTAAGGAAFNFGYPRTVIASLHFGF